MRKFTFYIGLILSIPTIVGCVQSLENIVGQKTPYIGEKKSGVPPASFGRDIEYQHESLEAKKLMEEGVDFYRRKEKLVEVPIKEEHKLYIQADRIFQKDKGLSGDGVITDKESKAFRDHQFREYEDAIIKAK